MQQIYVLLISLLLLMIRQNDRYIQLFHVRVLLGCIQMNGFAHALRRGKFMEKVKMKQECYNMLTRVSVILPIYQKYIN